MRGRHRFLQRESPEYLVDLSTAHQCRPSPRPALFPCSSPSDPKIQWYNQGADQYHTCETLLFDSGPQYPNTSVFQIHNVGKVNLNKLVIGKPLTRTGAANGYMDPGELKRCVELARGKGWDAGVMYWEWDHTAQSALRAVLDK